MSEAYRCSAASEEMCEQLAGSASTVRAFLLVEAPGPWGVDAVRDSRLPADVKQRLRGLEKVHRVRPLLIRQHHRRPTDGVRVFASFVHTEQPWAETTRLSDVRDLLDIDLRGLAVGIRPGLTPHDEPLYLVCTHGRHDACCAERGRPLCRALHEADPGHSWEVSHIGGDRFAPNLLVLPHGLYYGRLDPATAHDFVAAHRKGRLDLEHLRGRCLFGFSVQAAEIYLRRHLGHDDLAPLELVEHDRHGFETRVVFAVAGVRWEVRVHTAPGERRQLTCRATAPGLPLDHQLVALTPAG